MSKKPSSERIVLVPVDFSKDSAAALIHGARYADNAGMDILVLHVVHDPGDAPGFYLRKKKGKGAKLLRRLEDMGAEMLDQFLDEQRSRHPKLRSLQKAEKLLVSGVPVPRILDVVRKRKPNIVIMGSQGRTGLSRLLLGSKAEQCVKLCPVPITIVKSADSGKRD